MGKKEFAVLGSWNEGKKSTGAGGGPDLAAPLEAVLELAAPGLHSATADGDGPLG